MVGIELELSNYPRCLMKIFRTDEGDYLLYVHIHQEDGKALYPRTILRSASKLIIYSRLKYHLEQVYPGAEVEEQWQDIARFLSEVSDVLKITNGSK